MAGPPMNTLTVRPDRLDRLRRICLALPEASEKVAWGDPTWRVRDKIFAMQKGNHVGGRPSVWLKAPDGAQAMLVEAAPERLFVPPYVGSKGWVGVWLDGGRIEWKELAGLVETSYRLIAPAKLAAALDGGQARPATRARGRGAPRRR